MDALEKLLGGNGYKFRKLPLDGNGFYHALHRIRCQSESSTLRDAQRMRSEIAEFERKHEFYFKLFLPNLCQFNETESAADVLQKDIEIANKNKLPPSLREIFAASEVLQQQICVVHCDKSRGVHISSLQGYIFSPVIRSITNGDGKPVILLMDKIPNSQTVFAIIELQQQPSTLESSPGKMVNKGHENCIGHRFLNDFLKIFEEKVSGVQPDVKDFFARLSLEIYGDKKYRKHILNMVCEYELEEDNLDLFSKYLDNSTEVKKDVRERRLREHINRIRDSSKQPGVGEFLAASSVVNVDIYIDKLCKDDWEMYMPVNCSYSATFISPIILRKQTRDMGDYLPYVTHPDKCHCKQNKPVIPGKIGMIKENIYKAVRAKICCEPISTHGGNFCHLHLKHIENSKQHVEERVRYYIPSNEISTVIERLSNEERMIDQINDGQGTLYKCLAKEVFGDENRYFSRELQFILGQHPDDIEMQIQSSADWLRVPVYVYSNVINHGNLVSGRHNWKCYEPSQRTVTVPPGNKSCKFYVTLFYNRITGWFDRIVPKVGCNCQILPPFSVLKNNAEPELPVSVFVVEKEDRHDPVVSFFKQEPDDSLFTIEIRDVPSCAPYSEIRMVIEREDMSQRMIDTVHYADHSFLRCLSKEIFGSEQNIDLILHEICEEILQNARYYEPFMNEEIKTQLHQKFKKPLKSPQVEMEEMAKIAIERIEDNFDTTELLLWAASTFLQTYIYVLHINHSKTRSESYWTEYSQLRTKPKLLSIQKRKTKIKCPKGKYYITFFQSGAKTFYRVIPKGEICNCMIPPPCTGDTVVDKSSTLPRNELSLLSQMRETETALQIVELAIDDWMKHNFRLQQRCDAVIDVIEDRRGNVNIATMTGSGAGIVGAILTGVGIAAVPLTGGVSALLTIGGGVLATMGGTVAAGSKIVETTLNNKTIDTLKRNQNCCEEKMEDLQICLLNLADIVKHLGDLASEAQVNQNLEEFDYGALQSLPGILRTVKGLTMIPLGILRVSVRGITILGAIIGPLTAIIDAGLFAFSAWNMFRGNKTDVTENLRRISAALRASRIQMHCWAYGNQQACFYK